jgi:hypothetical protein
LNEARNVRWSRAVIMSGRLCHPERSEGSFAMLTKDPSLRSG